MPNGNFKLSSIEIDPGAPADPKSGLFGFDFTENNAQLVILPVPWEATTSYGGGTSLAPNAILRASHQVDLNGDAGNLFSSKGLMLAKEISKIKTLNKKAKTLAQKIIKNPVLAKSNSGQKICVDVNEISHTINQIVYAESKRLLADGKALGILGGDHSSPFGAIQAISEKFPDLSILHFDAHRDLRPGYEGFEHSHASIMYNILKHTGINKLVQVGIRDSCDQEEKLAQEDSRVASFTDRELAQTLEGKPFAPLVSKMMEALTSTVYLSFDIDGLDPNLCPHTGTPVPGGLSFREVLFIFEYLKKSGKKVVGFDLCEVVPGPKDAWDANVAARILYQLAHLTLASVH